MKTRIIACLIMVSMASGALIVRAGGIEINHRSPLSVEYQLCGQEKSSDLAEVGLPMDDPESKTNEMETLSHNNARSGGYGALVLKGSKFRDESILIMGIRGAWLINQSLGFGLDLNGILPLSTYDDIDPEGIDNGILTGGYGGFLLEPVLWPNKIVHVTIPLSIGAGWLGYIEDWENHKYDYHGDLYDDDVFWYIEPGVNVEINVTRFFRVNAGVSKRFSQGLTLINTPADAFDKINYAITLKFGGF